MRGIWIFWCAAAAIAAGLVLSAGAGTPVARADPSTVSWDVVTCVSGVDLGGSAAADVCTTENGNPTFEDVFGPGTIDPGDHPEVVSSLWVDTAAGASPEEPLPDLADVVFPKGGPHR